MRKPNIRTLVLLLPLFLAAGCAATRQAARSAPPGARLTFRAPAAVSVSVAGSFNRWSRDTHPLAGPGPGGLWTITVTLPPGRYEYLFLIDGESWELDPEAPEADDGMGGRNSLLTVPAPGDGNLFPAAASNGQTGIAERPDDARGSRGP